MNDSSAAFFPDVMRCEFVIRFSTPAILDDYPGAAWRSGLGEVLRPLWCEYAHPVDEKGRDSRPECECAFLSDWRTTEGWNPAAFAQGVRGEGRGTVPRPFIIDALHGGRQHFEAGDKTRVRLTLAGKAIDRWDDWRKAFMRLGARGLGREYKAGKGRFTVEAILDGDGLTPLTGRSAAELIGRPRLLAEADLEKRVRTLRGQGGDRRLTVVFMRPLQLRDKQAGGPLSFRSFWDALTGRIESLVRYSAGTGLVADFKGLAKLAQQVQVADAVLHEMHLERVSRRGHHGLFPPVQGEGAVGHLTLEADSGLLAEFLPLLAQGEWLHVGRHCNTGLGAYRLLAGE